AAGVRPLHAARSSGRLHRPRCPAAKGASDHLRHTAGAPDGARRRGRGDGRLQHVLRDPLVRQAGPDRAAHGAAPRAVYSRPPRLPEPFTAQESPAPDQPGLPTDTAPLRHPTTPPRHSIHGQIRAPVLYLPEYLKDEPRRVVAAWRRARQLPGYAAARSVWLADLVRDPTPNRMRRFGQALVLAAEMDRDTRHLHAHFLHTPASVARYAAII